MADSTLDIILRIRKQGNGAKETEKELTSLQDNVKNLNGAMSALAGGAAIGAVVAGLTYSIKAAMEAEQVMAATENAIKATGGAAGLTADQIASMANSLASISGVEDETIQSGQNLLLTFKEIKGQTFERASAAMLDMAVAMNQGSLEGLDLKSTAIQLGKALNVAAGDTEGASRALSALSRVGVSFTSSQKDAAKAAIEMGDVAKFQSIVLSELESEFGGAAETAGNTAAGAFAKLQVATGNLAEEVGGQLLPVLTDYTNRLTAIVGIIPRIDAALAEHNNQVTKTAASYQDYVAEMDRAAESVGKRAVTQDEFNQIQNQALFGALEMTGFMVIQSQAEFDLARATNGTTEEMRLKNEAINLIAQSESDALPTEEEYKEQQKQLKGELGELNALIGGQLGPELDRFKDRAGELTTKGGELRDRITELESKKWLTEAQKTELEGLRTDLAENNTAIAENAAAHDEATKRILFNLLQQRAAADGLTSAELTALTSVAQNWGLIDEATATATGKIDAALSGLNNGGSLDQFLTNMYDLSGPAKDQTVTASSELETSFAKTGDAIEDKFLSKTKDVVTQAKDKIPAAVKATTLATQDYTKLLEEDMTAGGPIDRYIIGLSKIAGEYKNIVYWAKQVPGVPGTGGTTTPTGKAFGGPVEGGTMYTVGERGPETFIAPSDGFIIPNGANLNTSATGGAGGFGDQRGPVSLTIPVVLDGREVTRIVVDNLDNALTEKGRYIPQIA